VSIHHLSRGSARRYPHKSAAWILQRLNKAANGGNLPKPGVRGFRCRLSGAKLRDAAGLDVCRNELARGRPSADATAMSAFLPTKMG
jgi:hypothetical protein